MMRSRGVLVAFWVLVCSACAAREQVLQIPRGSTELGGAEATAAFDAISRELSGQYRIRALARTRVEAREEVQLLRYLLVYENPDRARLEVLPRGAAFALAVLVADRGQGTLLDTSNREAYQGTLDVRQVNRLTGIPADAVHLAALLLGQVPADWLGRDKSRIFDGGAGDYLVLTRNKSAFFRFDQARQGLDWAELRDPFDERLLARFEYEGEIDCNTSRLPAIVRVAVPRYDASAELRFTSASCGSSESTQNPFSISIPPDYRLQK